MFEEAKFIEKFNIFRSYNIQDGIGRLSKTCLLHEFLKVDFVFESISCNPVHWLALQMLRSVQNLSTN